jgi:succinoglycan biosynthesis transport protein ExoP
VPESKAGSRRAAPRISTLSKKMLQADPARHAPAFLRPPADSKEGSVAELVDFALGFLRRRILVILAALVAVVPIGEYLALKLVPAYFAATATIIIDTRKYQIFQHTTMVGDTMIDAAGVESQLEILKSESVALEVVRKLNLAGDPEFGSPTPGILGLLLVPSREAASDSDRERRALAVLWKQLTVRRIGPTYVIEITFRSPHAERAAEVANAIGEAYINEQLEGKYDATHRASSWLESRLKELSDQSSATQRTVVEFKEKNNIVDAGNGRLMFEQQLSELSPQIVPAHERTAEAAARLQRVQEVLNSDSEDATINSAVADSLKNDIVTNLRTQFLELANREVEWSAHYGANHLAVVNLRTQMRQIRTALRDELKRAAETYKAEYKIARQHEENLKTELARVISEVEAANEARVTLSQLESSAQSYRSLYDNFLQRYMESVEQQTFPITEAKLITKATAPKERDFRKTLVAVAAVPAGGLALGIALAFLIELMDRAIRSSRQAEIALRTSCLALIPLVEGSKRKWSRSERGAGKSAAHERTIVRGSGPIWHTVDHPFSLVSEAIRSIKLAMDQRCSELSKVVGLTSCLPDEGKSTVAASLAQGIAVAGSRVVLVDCDLRNPSLSKMLSPGATLGFIDAICGTIALRDVIWKDPDTGMAFLPAGTNSPLAHSAEILGSGAANDLFASLREEYEYVIVDLSPLVPVVDVRATAQLVDCYLLVVEWGRTRVEMVQRALVDTPGVHENLLGVVLNKTDFKRLSGYDVTLSRFYGKSYKGVSRQAQFCVDFPLASLRRATALCDLRKHPRSSVGRGELGPAGGT